MELATGEYLYNVTQEVSGNFTVFSQSANPTDTKITLSIDSREIGILVNATVLDSSITFRNINITGNFLVPQADDSIAVDVVGAAAISLDNVILSCISSLGPCRSFRTRDSLSVYISRSIISVRREGGDCYGICLGLLAHTNAFSGDHVHYCTTRPSERIIF